MFQDTNDKIDNLIKQEKIECMVQVKGIRKKHNELKEKSSKLATLV